MLVWKYGHWQACNHLQMANKFFCQFVRPFVSKGMIPPIEKFEEIFSRYVSENFSIMFQSLSVPLHSDLCVIAFCLQFNFRNYIL